MNDQTKADALDALQELAEHISAELENELVSSEIAYGELNLVVVAEHILKVLKFLRDDATCRFVVPIDITGVTIQVAKSGLMWCITCSALTRTSAFA